MQQFYSWFDDLEQQLNLQEEEKYQYCFFFFFVLFS